MFQDTCIMCHILSDKQAKKTVHVGNITIYYTTTLKWLYTKWLSAFGLCSDTIHLADGTTYLRFLSIKYMMLLMKVKAKAIQARMKE